MMNGMILNAKGVRLALIVAAGLLLLCPRPVSAYGGAHDDYSGPYFDQDGRDWAYERMWIDPTAPSFESQAPGAAPACPLTGYQCHSFSPTPGPETPKPATAQQRPAD